MDRRSLLPVLALSVIGAACYDSRWGQTKAAQTHYAAASAPAAIESAEPASARAAHVWRVRFRPDAQYLAQTIDAPRQLGDLVADADGALAASLPLQLTVDKIEPWSASSDDDVDGALAALQRDDDGAGVDLVIGLLGALPRPTDSLHEVGRATILGHHAVLRAAGRLGEHDAVDRTFDELSEEERARIGKARKRHRALAVLLHELGHCLGALHEVDRESLMNPAYDPKMSGFGPETVALMRAALEGDSPESVARARLAILDGGSGAWVVAERDAERARLHGLLDATPQTSARPSASPSATAVESGPPELSAEERERLARARQAFVAGAIGVAYAEAKPLFVAYPDVYAVQDLRCQLATVRHLESAAMLTECAPFSRLLGAADAGAR